MNPQDQLVWLREEIDQIVKRYAGYSERYKRHALILRIVSVFLAAIITVLLGVKLGSEALAKQLGNVALFLGAAITVLSAYEAFFDPRALWVRETVTFARLKDLQRDMRFWEAGQDPKNIDVEQLKRFKVRLDSVLQDTLKYWMKIRGAPDLEKSLEARAELKPNVEEPGKA